MSRGHDTATPRRHRSPIATTERGIWAIKWSFVILAFTTALQIVVVSLSGSVALLADTITMSAMRGRRSRSGSPSCWRGASLRGHSPMAGRVEDLAGIVIVLIILFSAIVAGYQAIDRLIDPQPIAHLGGVASRASSASSATRRWRCSASASAARSIARP